MFLKSNWVPDQQSKFFHARWIRRVARSRRMCTTSWCTCRSLARRSLSWSCVGDSTAISADIAYSAWASSSSAYVLAHNLVHALQCACGSPWTAFFSRFFNKVSMCFPYRNFDRPSSTVNLGFNKKSFIIWKCNFIPVATKAGVRTIVPISLYTPSWIISLYIIKPNVNYRSTWNTLCNELERAVWRQTFERKQNPYGECSQVNCRF